MNPRTKTTDAAKTPAVNPADATPAPVLQPPNAAPETEADKQQSAVAALPGGVVPGVRPPTSPQMPAVDAPQAPPTNPPAATPADPDPFVVIWQHQQRIYSVRAMKVPGGCIIARAMSAGGHSNVALCFVPGATLDDASQLVAI